MQVGYLPAEYRGKIVPVKVMYYLMDKEYTSWNRNYKVRIRPYVLADYDKELPLNPVATNPYRNIIKWLDFGNASAGGDQVSNEIRPGATLERQVIPGFLSVKCRVDDVKQDYSGTTLDTWAPGYYYQDGAPWMIGDEQYVGIHQASADTNETTLTMTCWGVQKNPNDPAVAPEGRKIPLSAFVLMDAESTDGSGESLSIELVGAPANQEYFPINGYSSCNATARKLLSEQPGFSGTVRNAIGAISFTGAPDGGSRLTFTNPLGRCGEVNDGQNGVIFGPALMAVAPISNPSFSNPEQTVKVHMKGAGKQALALGVILGGDTSNADYNNGMPPVFQYSALGFYGGLTQDNPTGRSGIARSVSDSSMLAAARSARTLGPMSNARVSLMGTSRDSNTQIDWTLPENYNHNYYYYGSRIGKKSKALNDQRTIEHNGHDTSNLPMRLRDGDTNDGLYSQLISMKQGSDTTERLQPRLLPVENAAVGSHYSGTGADGKYLASQDALIMSIKADGAHLSNVPRPTTDLSVGFLCGTAQGTKTYVRGWADFNGNGVFDPEEASTNIAVCGENTKQLRTDAEMSEITNEMPWTDSVPVELKFTYPKHHDLKGKRDVWMRLRAVSAKDETILSANNRFSVEAYSSVVVQKNPDDDAPKDLRSAQGSFELVSSGETEDYTFIITPPPTTNDDAFCMPARDSSLTIDVLANDIDPYNEREVDPNTLAFVAGQEGVVVSDNGKKAVRENEGTYTVDNGKVVFTPATQLVEKMQKLTASSKPITIKGLEYAVATKDGETVYHRSLANKAKVSGSAQFACQLQSQLSYWYEKEGKYQWDLTKEVLKGNTGTEYVTSGDVRDMSDAADGAKVPLTYRLKVTAKENGVTTKAIKGTVAIINPTNQAVTTGTTTGATITVTPAVSGLTCTFDDPESVKGLSIPANTSSAITRAFTCTTATAGVDIPSTGLTVTPHLETSTAQTEIAADAADESKTVVSGGSDAIRIVDSLKVGADGAQDPKTTDLNDAQVSYNGSEVPLSSLVLRASQIIANHPVTTPAVEGKGEVTLTMALPETTQPVVPTKAEKKLNYTNTAQLCDAAADGCAPVEKIPNPTVPNDPKTVPPAEVTTVVTREKSEAPSVTIRKVGGEDGTTPLKGSNFALYNDNNGSPSDEITGGITPVLAAGQQEGDATEFTTMKLKADTPYWLVEVKAPVGHQLLAEPVKFRVSTAGEITILKGGSEFITATNDASKPVITVRDVEVGHLPASGGRGVLISLALGLSLLGVSSIARRPWRRQK